MDVDTLFGPLFTQTLAAGNDVVPLAIPVLVFFAVIGIVLAVTRKFGIKTR